MENKNFLDVNDVANYMGISIPTAYKVIKKMNNELDGLGYITVAGRISKQFFETKVFGCSTWKGGENYASV